MTKLLIGDEMKSIINNEKLCLICGTTKGLHKHHVFFGVNRKHADQDGLWVYLCGRHHNLSNEGVHFNKDLDNALKKLGQKKYEETHSRDEFMERYRRNYL